MSKDSIHIIGGGIIGLCSAWYLSEEGFDITIIDRTDLTDGTSHGNAGMVVPSHFIPMASPGVITQGVKWMFSKSSPFYIKPRLNSELMSWIWNFYRSCNIKHVEQCIPVLYELNNYSKELYQELSERNDFDFSFEKKGLLMLYRTEKQEHEEKEMGEKANSLGIDARILGPSQLKELEPSTRIDALGGLYFPGDAHLSPNTLIAQLVKNLKQKGVSFLTNHTVTDIKSSNGRIKMLLFSDGKEMNIENLVIAGGSWTGHLLKKAGIKMSLQDGKGYSMTIPGPSGAPGIPTILSEAKVAVTPMGQRLRIGGTLELSGLSKKINQSRLKGITDSFKTYYPEVELKESELQPVWSGYRPCTPDGMPYIDRSKNFSNLTVATGHGMMGISMGPATGKLVSQLLTDQTPFCDTSLLKLDRF